MRLIIDESGFSIFQVLKNPLTVFVILLHEPTFFLFFSGKEGTNGTVPCKLLLLHEYEYNHH